MSGKECCPVFDPEPWDGTAHEWYEKPFLFATIPQFFHMPLPWKYAAVVARMWKKAEALGAAPEMKDFLLMAYDPSPWKSELYLALTKAVRDPGCRTLSGSFVSKTFDGPYRDVPKYLASFESWLSGLGKAAAKYYFYFTTCPKCAKKYGHNWVVAFAELKGA